MTNLFRFTIMMFLILYSSSTQGWAQDCWISVNGSGLKNGDSLLNAYSASDGPESKFAQKCWNQTGPSDTMHVAAGEYSIENGAFWQLKINASHDGSKSNNFKKLIGHGKVMIQGRRTVPYQMAKNAEGGDWIKIEKAAKNILIKHFYVSRVAEGVVADEGENENFQFRELHFQDTRQNFVIYGHPNCSEEKKCNVDKTKLSKNFLIQNTSGLRYSKRHVRLSHGVSGVRVVNSQADAELLDGDFAVGFDVENPSHDIEFLRCSARRNVYTLTPYWNGDGFKAENETRNIRWIDCSAFDNGDGGFDIKTQNAYLENIVAMRNNRNIRTWGLQKATLKNINASYSKHSGGEGTQAGLWTQGEIDCYHCTLHNNQIQAQTENNGHRSSINFYDSILSMDKTIKGELIQEEKGSQIQLIRTELWKENVSGKNPEYKWATHSDGTGFNQNFNSQYYGKTKGYYYGA